MSIQSKTNRGIMLICIFALTFFSCHNFYKATSVTPLQSGKAIDSLENKNRYFILREGDKAYYMNDIKLSDDQSTLTCRLDTLPDNHKMYLTRQLKGKQQYKTSGDLGILNEVHLFINPSEPVSYGQYTLSLNKVQKIEVIEKDKGKTTGSYVIGAIGYTVGAIVVVAVIVAAIKSSCPFVSAYTGNGFELQGEIYGGAIYPQLARDDYMPLQMQPTEDGKLMVKISNELKEIQYTDVADLLVITHDKNSSVLADNNGNLYSIFHPSAPVKAWTSNGNDAFNFLTAENDNQVLHFDDTLSGHSNNYVITQFKNEKKSAKAKLVLSIKNSYWMDYLYSDLAKKFGTYYASYVKKQNKRPASELINWAKQQNIPLQVSIKTSKGWEKVTELNTIGPLAMRELVVPLDLTDVDDNILEIKLSSGFMFWEIDYAAVDFSDDANFSVQKISPSSAIDETGKNVLPVLSNKDNKYLEQPDIGNVVTLTYDCTPQPGNVSRSYILKTSGYYTHSWDFNSKPDYAFLKGLKKPDAFPAYSLSLYKKFINSNQATLVSK